MQRISVNLTNNCDGNKLNYNNDLPAIEIKNRALQKPFEKDFLTVILNAKLRPSFVICWVAQGSRPRCGPRHPILHSNIFFYVKLLTTIILSWNSFECILWYSLELSDLFIKNENSVFPISTEINLNKKLTFVSWKWGQFFLKGNPIFLSNLVYRQNRVHQLQKYSFEKKRV